MEGSSIGPKFPGGIKRKKEICLSKRVMYIKYLGLNNVILIKHIYIMNHAPRMST